MTQNAAVEKVLRVGVIYNGKIIDEQVFRKPETIYIGDTSKAHFVVPSSALPSRFPIFYYKSGKYELVIMENMSGKVFLKGKVVDIEEVIKKGMLKKRGNAYILPLSTDARGKVVVGSAIVLFQFITPPPKTAEIEAPALDTRIVGSNDRLASGIYPGNGFHFGLFVPFYLWGMPSPAPKTFDQLDNRFAKMIAPEVEKVEDNKPVEEKKVEDGEGAAAAKKEEVAEAVEAPKKKKGPRDAETRAQEEEMRVSEMKKKVAGVGLLKLIGSAGSDGSAGIISDVMGEGGKDRDIDSALSGVKQIGIATDAGQRSRKGDAGATETAKIDDLKVANTSGNVKVSGMKEKEVTGSTKIGAPEVEGSLDQAGITKVVKQNSSAIQRCYEKALKTNPQLKGKVAVTWMINQDGRAEMVEISEDTMKDAGVSSCIKGVVSRWRFQKPEAPASVTFPFVFSPAN